MDDYMVRTVIDDLADGLCGLLLTLALHPSLTP